MIHTLCSVGVDLCWQLEKINIPFDEISDYILFCKLLSKQYTNKDTSILFDENLDFSKMNLYLNKESNSYILIDDESETEDKLIINEEIYFKLITYLREIHHLKRNEKVAGSGSCRRAFIEDALMEYEAQKYEPQKSFLLPMISTMVNSEGFKHDEQTVWDMNIYCFMDSVKRISKIRNSTLLLQSGYSGFGIDLNKLTNKEKLINYMGELD